VAARTIRLGGDDNAPEPVEVYIFEHKYHLRRITRSVQKNLEKVDKALAAAAKGEDGDDSDKIVAIMGDGLAALLQSNGTNAPNPKKVIVDSWKADELDLTQLSDLYDGLQEAATDRPT
jgi:hypothetical protein